MNQRSLLLLTLIIAGLVTACGGAPQPAASREDDTPRLAVISAFEQEYSLLRKEIQADGRFSLNGVEFTTGSLRGQDVVIFLSGESMVNAAMNTQLAIDHFNIRGVVFSGIAGGVNPNLHLGDVVIPAEWAQYQEQLFARQTETGWDTGIFGRPLGNYGMMFPQPVSVARPGGRTEDKVWFAADKDMLAAAETAAGAAELERCPAVGKCLPEPPVVVVGGRGVSGPTFVDNAEYRAWVWDAFQADALDMESAAAAHVAYANNKPFIAFRSLSDLAGAGRPLEIAVFLQLAAGNAARVTLAFLEAYPPVTPSVVR